jgi:hypothetical protein
MIKSVLVQTIHATEAAARIGTDELLPVPLTDKDMLAAKKFAKEGNHWLSLCSVIE